MKARKADLQAMSIPVLLAMALLPAVLQAAPVSAAHPPADLDALARQALAGDAAAEPAVAALRRAGPQGMARLLAAADRQAGLTSGQQAALDRACGVRDCARLRLFWYTDFEAARAAARASGKPILSLRLLGRLDEDLSCANSRFFRSILYPDARIGRLLRERFVLHWHSVRPVPKVTVDFGDGRTLERTVTGNSIHYVLDVHGRLVDVLPGLYGPAVFLEELRTAWRAAEAAGRLGDEDFAATVEAYRWRRLDDLAAALERDVTRLAAGDGARAAERTAARDPWAVLAATPGVQIERVDPARDTATSKMVVELPLLTALDAERPDEEWLALAELHRPGVRFDAGSRAFILAKHGVAEPARAGRLLANLAATVALEEVLNQYRLRPRIYRRLAELETPPDLDELNAWVYAEVFRMPEDDPWLGLAPEGVYAALPAAAAL